MHPSKNTNIREAVRAFTAGNLILTRPDLRRLLIQNETKGQLYWLRTLVREGILSPVAFGKYCAPHRRHEADAHETALRAAEKDDEENMKRAEHVARQATMLRLQQARLARDKNRLALAEAFTLHALHPRENQQIPDYKTGGWKTGEEYPGVYASYLCREYRKTPTADKRVNTALFLEVLSDLLEKGIVEPQFDSRTTLTNLTPYSVTYPKGRAHVKMARLLA